MTTVTRCVDADPSKGWNSETTNQIAPATTSSATTATMRTNHLRPRPGGCGSAERGRAGGGAAGGSSWSAASARNEAPPSGSSSSGISAVALRVRLPGDERVVGSERVQGRGVALVSGPRMRLVPGSVVGVVGPVVRVAGVGEVVGVLRPNGRRDVGGVGGPGVGRSAGRV